VRALRTKKVLLLRTAGGVPIGVGNETLLEKILQEMLELKGKTV
jgi:hypothetical protein